MRLGRSVFSRICRKEVQDFEKPDLVDFLNEHGFDLTIHEDGDRPYMNGPCPFHDWKNNDKTFVVYPDMQRCKCMSCSPEWMDVIDVYRKMYNVDFNTAKAQITIPLTHEQLLSKKLQEVPKPNTDLKFFAERQFSLWDRLDTASVRAVQEKVHAALHAGQPSLADQILRRYGV